MKDHYQERFLRNIGIMTETQLNLLRTKKIAVGGLGLGGSIFINLVRMGFEKFHISDPDHYERSNINRQRMAKETTIQCRKDECLLSEARSINPSIEVQLFREGVTGENADAFVRGCDYVVDGIDVFALSAKLSLHNSCQKMGLPVMTCGSVGYGSSVVIFNKKTPTFAELSGICRSNSQQMNVERFINFIAPKIPDYMIKQVRACVDQSTHIPFVVCGVESCASLAVGEISKYFLNFGQQVTAPFGIHIDPVSLVIEKYDCRYDRRNFMIDYNEAV